MVRRRELCGELRIVLCAEGDVGTEAAVAEHDRLVGANPLFAAGARLREPIAVANLEALNAAVFIANDCFDVALRANRDAVLLNVFHFLLDNGGARPVLRIHEARHRVSAFLADVIHDVLDAEFLYRPLPGRIGLLGHGLHLFGVVEPLAFAEDVFGEQLCAVLDAHCLLNGVAGNGNDAAVDDGVAAYGGHLLKNDDGTSTVFLRFGSGGKPRKSAADYDDVIVLVPLGGHGILAGGRCGRAGGGNSAGSG